MTMYKTTSYSKRELGPTN